MNNEMARALGALGIGGMDLGIIKSLTETSVERMVREVTGAGYLASTLEAARLADSQWHYKQEAKRLEELMGFNSVAKALEMTESLRPYRDTTVEQALRSMGVGPFDKLTREILDPWASMKSAAESLQRSVFGANESAAAVYESMHRKSITSYVDQFLSDSKKTLASAGLGLEEEAWKKFRELATGVPSWDDESQQSDDEQDAERSADSSHVAEPDPLAEQFGEVVGRLNKLIELQTESLALQAKKPGMSQEVKVAIYLCIFQSLLALLLFYYTPHWDAKVKAVADTAYSTATDDRQAKKRMTEAVSSLNLLNEYKETRRIARLPVRAHLNPKALSPVVGDVPKGALVVLLKEDGDWSCIEYTDSSGHKAGWVFSRHLSKLQ